MDCSSPENVKTVCFSVFGATIGLRLEAEINSGKVFGICYVEKEEIRIDNHSFPFALKSA